VRSLRSLAVLALAAALAAPAAVATAQDADPALPEVTVEDFTVTVVDGPDDEFTDVLIDARRYVPETASATTPAPVVLLAHGFGGNKTGYDALARAHAQMGYVAVTYSARGFGASTYEIGLDSIDFDVKDVRQLIDEIAAWDFVELDAPGDPVIGMHGDSYGGGIALQVAAVDDRLDAIAPRITWSSLVYSLTPNNLGTTFASPYDQPFGIFKQQWTTLFFTLGTAQPVLSPEGFPTIPPASECPGFVSGLCQTYLRISAQGRGDAEAVSLIQRSSPDVRSTGITAPTFLMQGQDDTLFNLREALRNEALIAANGTPTKVLFFNGGHSGPNADGERVDEANPTDILNNRLFAWWDRWLREDTTVDTGPALEWYRPWIDTTADTIEAAYTGADGYPVEPTTTWFLSGDGSIVTDATDVTAGEVSFVNPPGGQPAAFSEDALRQSPFPPTEQPGQHVTFDSAPVDEAIEVVGVPELRGLDLASVTGEAHVHVRLYDVAPDGSVELPRRMTAPFYAEDLATPLDVSTTGYVHRFEAGHRVRIVLASTDLSYSNRLVPDDYTVTVDPAAPTSLVLPLVTPTGPSPLPAAAPEPADDGDVAAAPQTGLPATGGGALLPAPARSGLREPSLARGYPRPIAAAAEPRTTPTVGDDSPQVMRARVERAATTALFANDRFRNLFIGTATSSFGDWVGLFAILALTESLLGATRAGAFAISGVMIARIVPTLALGPVAGVFVDRYDRKRTLIATDLVRGSVMIGVALVGDVFQLVVATFVIEVASTLFVPAKDATVPNIVDKDHLVQANQLNLMITYGTLPLGALGFALLIGGTNRLTEVLGDAVPFLVDRPLAVPIWINALTFFVSAAFISRIRFPAGTRTASPDAGADSPGAWQELREGFAFIVTKPLIRALIGGVMAAFLAAGVVVGVGKFFATILNAGDSGFGVLGFVVGLGLFGGLVAAGPLSSRFAKEQLFAPGIGIAGVALVVAAFMPRLDIAAVPAMVMGAGAGLSFVTGYTMLQEHADDAIRGRTFAAFNTGVRAALFAALVIGPLLVGLLGVERSASAIAAGDEGSVTDLEDSASARYPYQVGGVRLTLSLAGLVALGGAVTTGRALHRVLSRREGDELDLGVGVEPAGAVVPVRHGLFVAFEGGEGAGKSTQIRLLRAAVERAGHDVVVTREPGGTEIGERIREVLLDPASAAMDDRAEALLYAAARAQHAAEVIRPALEKGAVVLCDRYVDSSVVYQGVARGLGEEQVEELNRWGTMDLVPDLVVVLDIDPAVGLRRAGAEPDRLEAAGDDFHRTVNAAFRRRADATPGRYRRVDADRPAEEVHAEIRALVLGALDGSGSS
jgi:dTMP kinase